MNDAAMAMIHELQERKGLSALDAYSLASLAMDARIGRLEPGARSIHCLLPRNLWVPQG